MIEQVLQDMKAGVYNYTKDGKCSKCGGCCSNILPVSKEELKTIKAYIKRKHIEPIAYSDMTCPFLNAEKKCNIYEVRPHICRDFICDKPKKGITAAGFDNRFRTVFMTVEFPPKEIK